MAQPRILVGFTYDPPSRAALSESIRLAKATGAELVVFHAFEQYLSTTFDFPLTLEREGEARLLACDVSYARGLGVDTRLETTDYPMPEALLDSVVREAPDLVVVGTHGRWGVDRFLLGSVATRLLRDSTRPVLVVRPPRAAEHERLHTNHIVVGIDFEPPSLRALEDAVWLAKITGARISLIHVIAPHTRPEPDPTQRPSRKLALLAEETARRGIPCTSHVTVGDAATLIVAAAEGRADAVIAVGTRGRSRSARRLFGSIAEAVLDRTSCPVLVAHAGEAAITASIEGEQATR